MASLWLHVHITSDVLLQTHTRAGLLFLIPGEFLILRVIYPKRRSHFVVILFQILEIMCEENSDLYESSSPKPGIIAKETHLNTFSKAEFLSNLAETDVIVLAWPEALLVHQFQ